MKAATAKLWAKQNQHEGDRRRLFAAVSDAIDAERVLYPGSFVDIAPSFVFPDVTYLDLDKRAERFFADTDGTGEIIEADASDDRPRTVHFISGDYRDELDLPDESFDLLISLYAGFISEHCTRHLRVGGTLLVNPSHGDAAMASIDPRYELQAVVTSRSGRYRVDDRDLDGYLVLKPGRNRPEVVTRELLHELGRGVAYTRSPFAYLFRRVG